MTKEELTIIGKAILLQNVALQALCEYFDIDPSTSMKLNAGGNTYETTIEKILADANKAAEVLNQPKLTLVQ